MLILCRHDTRIQRHLLSAIFFFNDPATTEIYTLSLHDALPTSPERSSGLTVPSGRRRTLPVTLSTNSLRTRSRSEEHTSELQSRQYLVCRLLLEKKKNADTKHAPAHRDQHRHRAEQHEAPPAAD